MAVVDFTSALYLGLRHPASSLRPWQELTTGRPAALSNPPGADRAAQALARIVGCERGTLATSSLHIFWDLFEVLAKERIGIYIDMGAYPIAKWGVERVAAKGVRAAAFSQHDLDSLDSLLGRDSALGLRPVVVTDGVCPTTGKPAPLVGYLNRVRARGGYVVIDDTQALGILGRLPEHLAPYGVGGGGTLAWHGIQGPELIVGSSLAKGFGVPLAVLSGSTQMISKFEDLATTRVHCSPPSAPLISAAERALTINEGRGDDIRRYLARLVYRFRDRLRQVGLSATGGFFPVQTLKMAPGVDAIRLHERLLRRGVSTVLHRHKNWEGARLSFLITALHTPTDIDYCVELLEQACTVMQQKRGGRNRESTIYL